MNRALKEENVAKTADDEIIRGLQDYADCVTPECPDHAYRRGMHRRPAARAAARA
jgi:hypothetical protein